MLGQRPIYCYILVIHLTKHFVRMSEQETDIVPSKHKRYIHLAESLTSELIITSHFKHLNISLPQVTIKQANALQNQQHKQF